MTNPDAEAFEHYDDPARREPAPGSQRRLPSRVLAQQVPIRFPAETIEVVQGVAAEDGMTVSSWIRRAVEHAVRERGAPAADATEIT
jgi:hypothetical protein